MGLLGIRCPLKGRPGRLRLVGGALMLTVLTSFNLPRKASATLVAETPSQEASPHESSVKALRRVANALALAADRAHRRAQEAERLAGAARRRSNEAAAALRRLRKELKLPTSSPAPAPARGGKK